MEYRAKLTELWRAQTTLPKLLRKFADSQSDDTDSPHTYANKRVLLALHARLQRQGLMSKPDLSGVAADLLRAAARDELLADSRRCEAKMLTDK